MEQVSSGKFLVQNYGLNPAPSFNFMLRVEGLYDLPCRSIKVFHRENEYEMIQEGGLNDYVHMRRKPISKPFTFQVERYVGSDVLDPLANGTDLTLPILLIITRYLTYEEAMMVRTYAFTGCTVMSKEYGELNAEKSGLLTEVTTVGYREMLCLDNVANNFYQGDTWKFDPQQKTENELGPDGKPVLDENGNPKVKALTMPDGTPIYITNKKGSGPLRARHDPYWDNPDYSQDSAAEKAKGNMWRFDGKKKEGNEKRSAVTYKEKSLTDADKDAKNNMWHFDSKTVTEASFGKDGMPISKPPVTIVPKNGSGPLNANHDPYWDNAEYTLEKAKKRAEANMWRFDGTAKAGSGKKSAAQPKSSEKTLLEADAAAQKNTWHFAYEAATLKGVDQDGNPTETPVTRLDGTPINISKTKKGTGPLNAVHDINWSNEEYSLSRATERAKGHTWQFAGTTKAGNGTQSAVQPKNPEKTLTEASAENLKNEWQFSGTTKAGNGAQSAAQPENPEKTLAEASAENVKNQWQFNGTTKAGNGMQSAIPPENPEKTITEAAAASEERHWQFNGTAKAGNGKQSAVHPEGDDGPALEAAKKRAEANRWSSKNKKARSAVDVKDMHKGKAPKARKWPPTRSAVDVAKFLSGKKS